MPVVSVRLPEALAQWLVREAKQTHRSRSAIVREALEAKCYSHDDKPAAKRITMAEAMADLCGTISGPRDLSAHPKYLDGLGQ